MFSRFYVSLKNGLDSYATSCPIVRQEAIVPGLTRVANELHHTTISKNDRNHGQNAAFL